MATCGPTRINEYLLRKFKKKVATGLHCNIGNRVWSTMTILLIWIKSPISDHPRIILNSWDPDPELLNISVLRPWLSQANLVWSVMPRWQSVLLVRSWCLADNWISAAHFHFSCHSSSSPLYPSSLRLATNFLSFICYHRHASSTVCNHHWSNLSSLVSV